MREQQGEIWGAVSREDHPPWRWGGGTALCGCGQRELRWGRLPTGFHWPELGGPAG